MVPKGLEALFAPRSIAFVGASDDPSRIGGRPLAYCLRDGFCGDLFPVNPSRKTIQGLPAFASIADIPVDTLDLVVIAIAPPAIPQALEQAAQKSARAAVIFTSGFSEMGPEGAQLQAEMLAAADRHSIRLLGPNCLGLFDNSTGLAATFSSMLEEDPLPPGPVGIVSQSGAYGAHICMLLRKRGVGITQFVATGNECDIDIAELIESMANHAQIKVIACYAEGISDGRRLLSAIEKARQAGKPVLLMKVGRSATGRSAAQSHTASLAGDDRTFDALLRQSGSVIVGTTRALVDALYVLCKAGPLANNRLGILTVSGGAGILMADAAENCGLDVSPMPSQARKALDTRIPLGSSINPVDTTAQVMNDPSILSDAVNAMLSDGGYGAIAAFFMNWPESNILGPAIRAAVTESLQQSPSAHFAICMNAAADTVDHYDRAGMLVFEDPEQAILALSIASEVARKLTAPVMAIAPLPGPAEGVAWDQYDEADALKALGDAGVPVAPFATANSEEEAATKSGRFEGSLAIKVLSPDIQHKSDIGGVELEVQAGQAAGVATSAMLSRVLTAAPDADIRGVIISPMITGIAELIIGARIDETFGPIVTVGLGGTFTEILEDIAIGLAPINNEDALGLIRSLRGFKLLAGARGRPHADIEAAAQAMVALSLFIAKHRETVAEVEINPLIVRESGAVAVDALIIPRAAREPV